MVSVAVSWDLYLQTRSSLVLGNVGFVQVAPFLLFALLAGSFADRHNRKIILLWTQFLVFGSAALLASISNSVLTIYTYLFLTATARAFQGPARLAILPNIVPPEALRNAITWNSSAQEIANVSGPALAGILLAIYGSRTVYGIQLIFTLLTLGAFSLIRVSPSRAPAMGHSTGVKSLLEGVRFVRNNKLILSA